MKITEPETEDGVLTRLHKWMIGRSMQGRGCADGTCEFDSQRESVNDE